MEAPEYQKPDAPGLSMNFDNTISVYYVVEPEETFEEAAGRVFGLLKEAQDRFPDWPRLFFLDIEGHRDATGPGGFEAPFFEFQQEFLFSVVGPFVTAMETPLTGPLLNPDGQRNDVPGRLRIAGGG